MIARVTSLVAARVPLLCSTSTLLLAVVIAALSGAFASALPQSLPAAIEPTGRFTLRFDDKQGWLLHRPDGAPTFLLALNHLVRSVASPPRRAALT